MKDLLAMTAAALATILTAQARVGETAKEVEVVIPDGKSIMEIYVHRTGTTDDVIEQLPKVNTSSNETAWRFDRKANR